MSQGTYSCSISGTMQNELSVDISRFDIEETIECFQTPDGIVQASDESEATSDKDEKIVPTPPPSPTADRTVKPSLFSLAQVSSKLNELWSSAREQIFGEDYWIPTDPYEIVFFLPELLRAHLIVFPKEENSPLYVVQGTLKNEPGTPLFHVVYERSKDCPAYSLFRSKGENGENEAFDLCRRCLECQLLFTTIDEKSPLSGRRAAMHDIINKLREQPLWKMIHVAIACNREDVFSEENIEYLNMNGTPFLDHMQMMVANEGKYPLHLAVEMNRIGIVKKMLQYGVDPAQRDVNGNNAFHYASLTSYQMLELLWEFEKTHSLLNNTNNEGYTPVTLAIRAANPRCLTTLRRFGAEMTIGPAGRNPLFEAMMNKGTKNGDIIKTILESSPELLKECDSSGNTAIHLAASKISLMHLLLQKGGEIDINRKNNAGQTALHLYTHKGDIGLIITLASYCCDVNSRDPTGNTALHIAVSKRNLETTRLLLCLGADPNITNYHGDSARHLASRLKQADVLQSLIVCGARSCDALKSGCVSGCVHDPDEITTHPDHEYWRRVCRDDPVFYPDEVMEHPIRDFLNKKTYGNMMSNYPIHKNHCNLLSMDGGGIRGLVIIQTLMALEDIMGESIYPYFDWVAGTSTGALVATALAQGKSLRDCQHIYLRFKDLIFDGWTRPYNSLTLENFMKQQVGEESLAEIKEPRLMISTVKADVFPVKLEFMRNYQLPISKEENEQLGFTDPATIPTWKALRRTSAAPMFFSPVDDKYIDGGIIANNPTLDLLSEVQVYNSTLHYLGQRENSLQLGCVFSLGTGQIPTSSVDPLHVELSNPVSSVFAFKNLSLILVDQVTATEGAPVERARMWCNSLQAPFFRLSAPLHKDIGLGTKDDHDIAHMMWDCVEYAHTNRVYLLKICEYLKRCGRRDQRKINLIGGPKNGETSDITSFEDSL